jgi:hypothetical protein
LAAVVPLAGLYYLASGGNTTALQLGGVGLVTIAGWELVGKER